MRGRLDREVEEFEDFIGIKSIHKIVENREDREGIHHSYSHLEVAWDFRDHMQEFREFDACIHSVLAVILGSKPDFPAAVCNCRADIFNYFVRRERAEFTSCMLYNAVGAGEIAALRDLADVNIGV